MERDRAAQYWTMRGAEKEVDPVAWAYSNPYPGFESIAGYFSFYPGRVECYVNDERVLPQPGGFYGGWVTKEIAGPFKGPIGTGGVVGGGTFSSRISSWGLPI